MDKEMLKYFSVYHGTPPIAIKGDYRCSVHYGNTYRLEEAKRQRDKAVVDVKMVILHTLEFLKCIGMEISNPESVYIENPTNIDYEQIKNDNSLISEEDIVWMKFTTTGHLGVVATSNDVGFDLPNSVDDYDKKVLKYNKFKKKKEYAWKHTSAGILIHQLGMGWNTSFVLIFPLKNIPEGYKRGDIERAVGNYLIEKNVPIIDFYSHNY